MTEVPDEASFTLAIELERMDPPVVRRVAVPSTIDLAGLHSVVQSAMGWENDHAYRFVSGETSVSGPWPDEGVAPEDMSLRAMLHDRGQQMSYVYDLGDWWEHTVTLESVGFVDAAGAGNDGQDGANAVRFLGGQGACPPEDCGGAGRYCFLLAALADPDDELHEEALERLGPDWDAAAGPLPS